jgi:hypothetical protein
MRKAKYIDNLPRLCPALAWVAILASFCRSIYFLFCLVINSYSTSGCFLDANSPSAQQEWPDWSCIFLPTCRLLMETIGLVNPGPSGCSPPPSACDHSGAWLLVAAWRAASHLGWPTGCASSLASPESPLLSQGEERPSCPLELLHRSQHWSPALYQVWLGHPLRRPPQSSSLQVLLLPACGWVP